MGLLDSLKDAHSGAVRKDSFGRERRREERNRKIASERRRLLSGGEPRVRGTVDKPDDGKITKKALEINREANERRKKMGLPPLKAEDVKEYEYGGEVGGSCRGGGAAVRGTKFRGVK